MALILELLQAVAAAAYFEKKTLWFLFLIWCTLILSGEIISGFKYLFGAEIMWISPFAK